jgi:hypothetical protein
VSPLHQPSLYDDYKIDDIKSGHLFPFCLIYSILFLFTDFSILGKMGIGLSWYVPEDPDIVVQFFCLNDYLCYLSVKRQSFTFS